MRTVHLLSVACTALICTALLSACATSGPQMAKQEHVELVDDPGLAAGTVLHGISGLRTGMTQDEAFALLREHGMLPSPVRMGDNLSWGRFFSLSADHYLALDFVGGQDADEAQGRLRSVAVQRKEGGETDFVAFVVILPGSRPETTGNVEALPPNGEARLVERVDDDGSRHGYLVLQRDGRADRRWPLGSIAGGRWSDVSLHRTTSGEKEAYWLTWDTGQEEKVASRWGAVLWFKDSEPVFWSGLWQRRESYRHPRDGYAYSYVTELTLRPDNDESVALTVTVSGSTVQTGEFSRTIECVPIENAVGNTTFVVRDRDSEMMARLLHIEGLAGIRSQLKAFRASDPADGSTAE